MNPQQSANNQQPVAVEPPQQVAVEASVQASAASPAVGAQPSQPIQGVDPTVPIMSTSHEATVASTQSMPSQQVIPGSETPSREMILLLVSVSFVCMVIAWYLTATAAVVGIFIALESIKRSVVLPRYMPGIFLGIIGAIINIFLAIIGYWL